MKWACAAAEDLDLLAALQGCLKSLAEQLGGDVPDLVVVFVSDHHRSQYETLSRELATAFPQAVRIGCGAQSVIGEGRELEASPGLSISAAVLTDVRLRPFRLGADVPPASGLAEWRRQVGMEADDEPQFLLFADGPSMDMEFVTQSLDRAYPGSVKIGGLASAPAPGENVLFLDGRIQTSGAVGIAMSGNLTLDSIVAQGCRPVGHPMFVTRCMDNILLEIDGRPPLEVLGSLYADADPREQELFRTSLFLGLEMRSSESEYGRGDFLIRNLLSSEEGAPALAVAGPLREAQVVQFHLRDAATAAADLEARLADFSEMPAGALLFSCIGRGKGLYGEADHDTGAFHRRHPEVPMGGFFCDGEIGPVQQRTFLHGYTSVFGLFREKAS